MSAAENLPPDVAERVGRAMAAGPRMSDLGAPWSDPIPLDRLGALPPFPVEALPSWAAEYVGALATSTATPADLAGMLTLAVFAACAGGRVWLDVREDWAEPLNLYVAAVLGSGELKSAVFERITAPLSAFEAEVVEEARPLVVEARARLEMAEQAAAQLKKVAGAAKAGDRRQAEAEAVSAALEVAEMAVPVEPRVLVDDLTPEALVGKMADQGGRLALFSDEGGVFGAMAGRYDSPKRGGASAGLDVWLKSHSGGRIRVDRVGRPANLVERATLTIGIAVQPDVLSGLFAVPGLKGRGVLGRFLYALPKSLLGRRNLSPPPVPVSVADRYRTEVLGLARTLWALPDTGARLFLSSAALDELVRFRASIEPRLGPAGDLSAMSEWAGKLHGAVARIAALLHLAEHHRGDWGQPVGLDAMQRAVSLGRYLLVHAIAAHDLMGADDDLDRARWLLGWLEEWDKPTITRREVMVSTSRSRFPDVGTTVETLDKLVDFGWLRPVESPPSKGRPVAGPTYQLHPSIHATQSTQHTQVPGRLPSVASVAFVAGNDPDEAPPPTDADLERWSAEADEEPW